MNKMIVEKNIICRVRKIRDRYILIGSNGCFEINLMGKRVWDDIDGEKDIKEIINDINREYDADISTIEEDICAFIESLLAIDAINVVN